MRRLRRFAKLELSSENVAANAKRKAEQIRFSGILPNHFPAQRKDACIRLGIFGFADLPVLHIHLRERSPREKIIGTQGCRLEPRSDRLPDPACLHQGHREGVPAIEEPVIESDALPVFLHRGLQVPDGEIAVGVVEQFFQFLGHDAQVAGNRFRCDEDSMRR